MAEREQKTQDRTATGRGEVVEEAPAASRARREAEGRARRPAGRDRRGARGQRRGVRPQLRAEGRAVTRSGAAHLPPGRRPGTGLREPAAALRGIRRPAGPNAELDGAPRHHGGGPALRATAWSWPGTAGPPRATRSPTGPWRRSSRPTAGRRWPSPARPGPAVEMVRLFQVQLEHYEKVEGVTLSLEGKANQLAQMVREHLPAGHAGPGRGPPLRRLRPAPRDRADLHLRRHRRPLRGGRLPGHRVGRARRPHHHQARLHGGPGSGRRGRAGHRGPLRGGRRGRRHRRARPRPGDLPARGRGRRRRATSRSTRPRWPNASCALIERKRAERARAPAAGATRHDHAVLRRPRAGHEGPGRVRPEGHRPGSVPRRHRLRRRRAHRGREPVPLAAQDQRDLRPDRLRRRRQVQRVRPAAGGRRPPRRHQGLRLQPGGRRRPVARQPLRPVPRQRVHPRDEAARGGDPRRRALGPTAVPTSCTTSPTRARSPTRTTSPCSAATPRRSPSGSPGRGRRAGISRRPSGPPSARSPDPTGPWPAATSRWPCSLGATAAAPSAGSPTARPMRCLGAVAPDVVATAAASDEPPAEAEVGDPPAD